MAPPDDTPASEGAAAQPEIPAAPFAADVPVEASIAAPEDPRPVLKVPDAPRPPPGGITFDGNGRPSPGDPITEKTRVYVQADGTKVTAKVAAQRKDGTLDILIPSGETEIRRDAVSRKTDDSQVGDYIE